MAEDRCKRSQYNSAQKANAQRTVYQVTRFQFLEELAIEVYPAPSFTSAGMRELSVFSPRTRAVIEPISSLGGRTEACPKLTLSKMPKPGQLSVGRKF